MDTIGKYQLVRVIGEGGMGRVYEAVDPMIGRRVAIKTVSLHVVADEETRARFFREAQAAGQLSHPNLITIHDIGDADGTPFIVMEFLEGLDLSREIRQKRLSYDAKIQLMIEVCQGLAFAHGHGIVHRDIKPANIFLTTTGLTKILDFGLARGAISELTQTGKILGTPNYMAPEQIRGEDVDHRADIFATGVVFYELLSGRKAFDGDSVATTLYKVLETQPPPITLLDEQLPAALSAVIDRALAKDRVARFQTSREMLDALLQAAGRSAHVDRSLPPTMPVKVAAAASAPPRRMPPAVGWALAGVIVAGVAGMALWTKRATNSANETIPPRPAAQTEARQLPPPAAPPQMPPVETTPASPSGGAILPAPADDKKATKPAIEKPPAAEGKRASSGSASRVTAPPEPAPVTKVLPAPPPPVTAPPTTVTTVTTVPPPEPAAAPIPSPRVTSPPVTPPQQPPATRAAPPPERVEESPTAAAQAILARYRAALEARDIGALKRIWPSLSGRQEDALRNEFEHSRAIAVGSRRRRHPSTSGGATVTCRRSYAVTTADGQTLSTATTMIMTLARRDGAWSIDTIRHEVAR